MPDITFTISTEVKQDLVDLYCDRYNYEDNKQGSETETQFALRMFKQERKKDLEEWRLDKYNSVYGTANKSWQDDYEVANPQPDPVVVT